MDNQVDNTERNKLSTYTKSNIDMDHIAITTTTISIKTQISSIPFAVYINNIYIHNKIYHHIRQQSPADGASNLLCKWSTTKINSIGRELQRKIIKKSPTHLKQH